MGERIYTTSPDDLSMPTLSEVEPDLVRLFEDQGFTFDDTTDTVADTNRADYADSDILAKKTIPQDEPGLAQLSEERKPVLQGEPATNLVQAGNRSPERSAKRNKKTSLARYTANVVGVAAAVVTAISTGVIPIPEGERPSFDDKEPTEEATQQNEASLESTTTIEPTTTTPTTTLPERERTFEVGHNELVGTLHIPLLCEDIEVYGYSEQEKIDDLIGTGSALLDRVVPADQPQEECSPLQERKSESGASQTRHDVIEANWQPIAGHEQGSDGGYLSVFPGQPGNFLVAGHGSTYSAPFVDIGLLQPGDEAVFTRSDGKEVTYKVLGSDILPDDNYDPFLNYSHPEYDSTMTVYRCGDLEGNIGSDAARYAVRFGEV